MIKYVSFFFACIGGIVSPLFSQDTSNSFTLEAILSSSFPTELVAAPAGDRVAWVLNKEGVRNIWTAAGPLWQAQRLTNFDKDDGQAITRLRFSGTEALVFIRGGGGNREGEIPNPTSDPQVAQQQIWKIGITGAEPTLLTKGSAFALSPDGQNMSYIRSGKVWLKSLADSSATKLLFSIRGRPSSLRWSPTGQQLAFVSNRGDHSFIGVYDLAGETIQYLAPSVDKDQSPVWSPDGTQLAFIRIPNEKQVLPFSPRRSGLSWSIQLANVASGEVGEVWKAPAGQGSVFRMISAKNQLFWGADNHLIFPWEGDGWTHL